MRLSKTFARTLFPTSVISEALADMETLRVPAEEKYKKDFEASGSAFLPYGARFTLSVGRGNEAWQFDSLDDRTGHLGNMGILRDQLPGQPRTCKEQVRNLPEVTDL